MGLLGVHLSFNDFNNFLSFCLMGRIRWNFFSFPPNLISGYHLSPFWLQGVYKNQLLSAASGCPTWNATRAYPS